MLSKLKAAWSRLAGGEAGASEGPPSPPSNTTATASEPAPYLSKGQYQTAGSIEKDTPEGVKEHRFIRADTYASRDDAIAFTISKAKQIVDQQGDAHLQVRELNGRQERPMPVVYQGDVAAEPFKGGATYQTLVGDARDRRRSASASRPRRPATRHPFTPTPTSRPSRCWRARARLGCRAATSSCA